MEIEVRDKDGNVKDMAWLKDRFGEVMIKPAARGEGPVFKITALREKVSGGMEHITRVVGEDRKGLGGIEVAWYWSGANADPDAGPVGGVIEGKMKPNVGIHGRTNTDGDVAPGMGDGARYRPDQGQIGPHAVWVRGRQTRSDVIYGIGWLPAPGRPRLDVEFTRFAEDPEESSIEETVVDEGTAGECPTDAIKARLDVLEGVVEEIRALLGQA
jgi:hypothetical protein